MADQRRGGIIQLSVDGVVYDAKGEATYNLGDPKREAVIGSDGKVHGFTEKVQVPFIELKFTDRGGLDTRALHNLTNSTVVLSLANGKLVTLRNSWYAAPGDGKTDEGEIDARFEGKSAQEITA